ncbi:hypothetical protein GQ597_10475 [Gilliamella sp. Pra-s65]|uniref:hypothetical protein n=1 Tax=unclassified Gilliamella TaxID=2685620 RepID=UPI001365BC72|nr:MULTISPECIES: hypothetical protein [unclassified Gilliamella]MWN91127.1 hypothetical protein [Gilliamella sp. Pra-s65]MWP73953.1 hypothetical protein [Gilliamella sp. Pra-s52]
MKNLINILILLLITIFSDYNIKIVYAGNIDKDSLAYDNFRGEKLISSKEFMLSINKTCKKDVSERCAISKIKKDYYLQFNNLTNDEITISKLKNNIELKLKKEQTNNPFFIEIELISYKNNERVDSIICYEYINDPNDSLATEKLYYLNDYNLWMLYFTYDLESTTADNWNKYKINPQSGKFELIDKVLQY